MTKFQLNGGLNEEIPAHFCPPSLIVPAQGTGPPAGPGGVALGGGAHPPRIHARELETQFLALKVRENTHQKVKKHRY